MNDFKNTKRLNHDDIMDLINYPISEGQTYFTKDTGIFFKDINGQRFAVANISKVDDLDSTKFAANQKKIRNTIIINRDTKTDTFNLFYIKEDGTATPLDFGEDGTLDHSALTFSSRSKPDQHPIEAISGLKPKVEVHVGKEEPIERTDTWFDISAADEEVAPSIRREAASSIGWEKLASTPIIFSGQVINCNPFSEAEPLKFVVVGDSAGEIYQQEFHSDEHGYIMGEAVIHISADYASIASVSFVLEPISGQNAFSVASFENTGNINISEFTALSIEVYR